MRHPDPHNIDFNGYNSDNIEKCVAKYRILSCATSGQSQVAVRGEHRCNAFHAVGAQSPVRATVTQPMKDFLRSWLNDCPTRTPMELFNKLEAAHARDEFGSSLMPSLQQVQDCVKYLRATEMRHQSTVQAAETELAKRMPNDNDSDNDRPFVFGIQVVNEKPVVGDSGINSFRAGTHFVFQSSSPLYSLYNYFVDTKLYHSGHHESRPQGDDSCRYNIQDYPIFVLGYSDRSCQFHLLSVSITSQRTTEDFKWFLDSLRSLMRRKFNYEWSPQLFMGDADRAQHRGLFDTFAPTNPEIQYLMCFFHVIKKCYEKKAGVTWLEWNTVSFGIYLLHMCDSFESLQAKMPDVYSSWEKSRELRKFRSYFYNTWLPHDIRFSQRNDMRFWKWQVYHSDSGGALTNNPNEQFNAELKRFIHNQKLHIPHLIQEICRLLAKESRAKKTWAAKPTLSDRLRRHFINLQKQRVLNWVSVMAAC
ncbi:hypothetical protein LEN26_019094 [Aphanomyces euteiches]|nr:hypothetical protein LEN26_019094 [Aphanomyces euteiches]